MSRADTSSDDLGLADYLSILKRRWAWIAATVLVFGGVGAALALRSESTYRSSAQVLLADSAAQDAVDPSSDNAATRNRAIGNELSLTGSDEFGERLDALVDGTTNIAVAADSDADVLRFTATADDPDTAAEHANAAAEVYVAIKQDSASGSIVAAVAQFRGRLDELREQRTRAGQPLVDIEDEIAATTDEARLSELEREYRRTQTAIDPELRLIDAEISSISDSITRLQLNGELASTGTAQIIQQARPQNNPINAGLTQSLVIGSLLGLLVGTALAFAAESLDKTIKSRDDLERHFRHPVLATIPRAPANRATDPGLAVADRNTSEIADGYHRLRSSLQFILASEPVTSIMVTSANPAEGKTTTSSNLAWAMAAIGRRVLLADVDFHRPRLHDIFGLDGDRGVTNLTLDNTPLPQLVCEVTSPVTTIRVLPAGPLPPNPADFVASQGFLESISTFTEAADLVVLDAPPVLPVSDAMALTRICDATIVTALAGATSTDELKQTISSLEQAGGRVIGIVLVGTKAEASYSKYSGKDQDPSGRAKLGSTRRSPGTGVVAVQPGRPNTAPPAALTNSAGRSDTPVESAH